MSIKKIAELVGVSYSTVSRVLSNPTYKCSSEEIRNKIIETARELSYIPNEAARNLRLGVEIKSGAYHLGILLTRTETADADPFFHQLTRIVESEIHKNMCILTKVWFKTAFSDDKYEDNYKDIVEEMYNSTTHKPDGLIIIGKCAPYAIKVLKSSFKYIVSINRNSTNYEVDEVICDGKKIAAAAVEYLISLGHRKIGYIGGCHNESRYKGYLDTLFKYNLDSDIDYTIEVLHSEEKGYKAMESFIQHRNPPTGIYCANDIVAIGMIKCLNKYKNRYYTPSIISSDDIEEAQYVKPMLTTVRLPQEDMAKFAVYLLLDRINNGHKAITKVELEGSLIIRESCSNVDNALNCEYFI